MADNGEAFGEHGERHHGIFLYDETIHIPLLIKMPGQTLAGRVETRVGLVDVAPSILKEAHFQIPKAMQGHPVLPNAGANHSTGDSVAEHPIYSESGYGHLSFGWSALHAWRARKYFFIDAPERELYDQTIDEAAAHNLAPELKA